MINKMLLTLPPPINDNNTLTLIYDPDEYHPVGWYIVVVDADGNEHDLPVSLPVTMEDRIYLYIKRTGGFTPDKIAGIIKLTDRSINVSIDKKEPVLNGAYLLIHALPATGYVYFY